MGERRMLLEGSNLGKHLQLEKELSDNAHTTRSFSRLALI